MKNIIFSLAIMTLFFTVGCSGNGEWVRHDCSPILYEDVHGKYIKNYEIGKPTTAYIGQSIVKVREYSSNLAK